MSCKDNWLQSLQEELSKLTEDHTKEELMKLSVEELKKLHHKYSAKDDEKSQAEANQIKEILDSRQKQEVTEMKKIIAAVSRHLFGSGKPEPKAEPEPEPKAEVKPEPKAEVKPQPRISPDLQRDRVQDEIDDRKAIEARVAAFKEKYPHGRGSPEPREERRIWTAGL